MATHFLPLSKKCVLHIYTPRQTSVAKFHENWCKTEEVVCDARFPPHFCHNMPLPCQHTFCHCPKNVSCTSTPQGKHLCQISWELVKNWGSSSRRKIFPPFLPICCYHGNTLSATVKKNVSCTSTPQGKHLCQISWELVKNWGSSSRRKIFPPFLP